MQENLYMCIEWAEKAWEKKQRSEFYFYENINTTEIPEEREKM